MTVDRKRGFFGIGIYQAKTQENIGTLWRSAALYGAQFIFTIGHRYHAQTSDTMKSERHIPLWHFADYAQFETCVPANAIIVCIEMSKRARPLPEICHPQQAIYLLGAEDHGLPDDILQGKQTVMIPTFLPYSLNVAVAGTIVMYDRYVKTSHKHVIREEG